MTRAMELELEISDLEIKIENGNTEDKNTEGLFLCPAYYPVWKGKLKTKEK